MTKNQFWKGSTFFVLFSFDLTHQPNVLEQGGEEDEEVVPGQRLSHAHPSAKTKRHKLVFLHQTPAPLKHLQKPLRPK